MIIIKYICIYTSKTRIQPHRTRIQETIHKTCQVMGLNLEQIYSNESKFKIFNFSPNLTHWRDVTFTSAWKKFLWTCHLQNNAGLIMGLVRFQIITGGCDILILLGLPFWYFNFGPQREEVPIRGISLLSIEMIITSHPIILLHLTICFLDNSAQRNQITIWASNDEITSILT